MSTVMSLLTVLISPKRNKKEPEVYFQNPVKHLRWSVLRKLLAAKGSDSED